MSINPSLKKIYTTVRQNGLRQTSFIRRVASAVSLLCFKADVSVYSLSKDLTTAVNDSFTSDRFELVFGVKHPVSLAVHVELTKVIPVLLSQNIKHVLVQFLAEFNDLISLTLAPWLLIAFSTTSSSRSSSSTLTKGGVLFVIVSLIECHSGKPQGAG